MILHRPTFLNTTTRPLTSLVNIYAAREGNWSIMALLTIIITSLSTSGFLALVIIYKFGKLAKVKQILNWELNFTGWCPRKMWYNANSVLQDQTIYAFPSQQSKIGFLGSWHSTYSFKVFSSSFPPTHLDIILKHISNQLIMSQPEEEAIATICCQLSKVIGNQGATLFGHKVSTFSLFYLLPSHRPWLHVFLFKLKAIMGQLSSRQNSATLFKYAPPLLPLMWHGEHFQYGRMSCARIRCILRVWSRFKLIIIPRNSPLFFYHPVATPLVADFFSVADPHISPSHAWHPKHWVRGCHANEGTG